MVLLNVQVSVDGTKLGILVFVLLIIVFFGYWVWTKIRKLKNASPSNPSHQKGSNSTGESSMPYESKSEPFSFYNDPTVSPSLIPSPIHPESEEMTGVQTRKKKDNLTQIEGIGPKINEVLNSAGIHSFEDLASTNPENLKTILLEAGQQYHLADPSSWPKQAGLAADGLWEVLKILQGQLRGGKQV